MSGRQFSMPYQIPPVGLLPPAADAAGRTSAYHSLKNALKAYVVFHVNQGNAATVALSLLQATDVAGDGSKALGATPIWLVADTSVSDALVAQAAAAHGRAPREVSFTGAWQTMKAFHEALVKASPSERERLVAAMLKAIAGHRVKDRPGRVEPRAAKRRPKKLRYLNEPRKQARKRLMANG